MFYISPLKEEVMHLSPRVVIFRDLLSDRDIAKVKELATPRVSCANVLVGLCGLCINNIIIIIIIIISC